MKSRTAQAIDARQIKAGRALLGWSQDDLAKASGLSIGTIRKLELGFVSPRSRTMNALVAAMEQENIEFTPFMGVQLKDSHIETIIGTPEQNALRLQKDIFMTMKDNSGEVLSLFADNSIATSMVIAGLNGLMNNGLKFRFIIQNNKKMIFDKSFYRCVNDSLLNHNLQVIYGRRVAIFERKSGDKYLNKKMVIIDNKTLSDSCKEIFDFIWCHGDYPA
ncbi:MAG: helix-turn-helix transcriptional regulator [Alphaproteobacteria bacterium]|nr:MAG: helix-turn-helix transcriptional regulator [Alphaproteobacteria bacterium]